MGEQGREEVRLSNYDITVRRTITTERFDHVTVAFNIVSERNHPTQIRLFEYIPPEVGIENIGFHPQFEGDRWHVDGNQVIFDRWLKPYEEVNTTFAVLNIGHEEAETILADPKLDLIAVAKQDLKSILEESETVGDIGNIAFNDLEIESAKSDPTLADGSSSAIDDEEFITELGRMLDAAVTETIEPTPTTGPTTKPPAMSNSEETPGPTDESTESLETEEGEASRASEPPDSESDGSGTDTFAEEASHIPIGDSGEKRVPAGKVAKILAEEFRDDRVSPEDRELIQEWLNSPSTHTDVRIQHLQQRISDLEAYTESLETFIDENGAGRKLINELKSTLHSLEAEIDSLDSRVDVTEEELTTVDDELSDMSGDLDAIRDQTDDFDTELTDLEAEVEDLDEEVDRIETLEGRAESIGEEIEKIEDDLESIDTFRDRLLSVLEQETEN